MVYGFGRRDTAKSSIRRSNRQHLSLPACDYGGTVSWDTYEGQQAMYVVLLDVGMADHPDGHTSGPSNEAVDRSEDEISVEM